MPGDFTNYTRIHYLVNCISDLTQFAVIVPVPGMTTFITTKYFMQKVLLIFRIFHLVIMDNGTPSKGVFTVVCDYLQLKYGCVSKRNHKTVLVEKIHRFLNKTVTIAIGDRNIHILGSFIDASIVVWYFWNIVPIDGTNIICSIPAIKRELKFPMYIPLKALQ